MFISPGTLHMFKNTYTGVDAALLGYGGVIDVVPTHMVHVYVKLGLVFGFICVCNSGSIRYEKAPRLVGKDVQ